MKLQIALAAVSLRNALKYRRGWNKNSPTVHLLRSLMPKDSNKGFRLYVPIGGPKAKVVPPVTVRNAVRKAGYRITDYLAKKCVKISDKEQKNVFNIGKVIGKDEVAKAAFDNDPQLQNSKTAEFTLVISCHPYDIIGMSTGRDWDIQSCMRLGDSLAKTHAGSNSRFVEKDVAEGTLVAYAIKTNDTNIKNPLGRCLLKPFKHEESDAIAYRRETRVYGNPVPGMIDTLSATIRKLNAHVPEGIYKINPNLYDDGVGETTTIGRPEINWRKNVLETLQEHPENFPSYASYQLNLATTTPYVAMRNILRTAQETQVPAVYVKQVAQLLVQHPKMIDEFIEDVIGNDNRISDNFSMFMENTKFAKYVNKEADRVYTEVKAELDEEPTYEWRSRAGQMSPIAAEENLAITIDANGLLYAAREYVSGELIPRKSAVAKNPALLNYVLRVANDVRGAAMYGSDGYLTRAEAILAKFKNVEMTPIDDEYTYIREMLQDDDPKLKTIATQLITRYASEGRYDLATHTLESLSGNSIKWNLLDRRCRRKLSRVKDDKFQMALGKLYGIFYKNLGRLEATEGRELLSHLKERGQGFDKLSTWINIIRERPEFMPYTWYEADAEYDDDDELMYELSHYNTSILAEVPNIIAPKNVHQKRIFDFLYTYMTVAGKNPPPFGEISDVAMQALSTTGLNDNVDYLKYPTVLTAQAATAIPFAKFVGSDLGNAYLQVFENKLALGMTIRALRNILADAVMTEQFALYCGAPANVDHGWNWFKQQPAKNRPTLATKVREYHKKITEFIATLPYNNEDDGKFIDEWVEYFTYKRADIEANVSKLRNMLLELRDPGGVLDEANTERDMIIKFLEPTA